MTNVGQLVVSDSIFAVMMDFCDRGGNWGKMEKHPGLAIGSSFWSKWTVGILVFAFGLVTAYAADHVERFPRVASPHLVGSTGPEGLVTLAGTPLEMGIVEHSMASVEHASGGVPAEAPIYPYRPATIIDPLPVLSVPSAGGPWHLQALPAGLIYRSYLAGAKEPRFAAQWVHDAERGWIWDITLGGRVGILRYGDDNPLRPQGWQLDIEGAAFPRLDLDELLDLEATDFRFGVPLTYGRDWYQTKLAYYHISSHLGDELMLRDPAVPRINYARDALVWGHSVFWTDALRLYAEAAWSFQTGEGTKPWEFQFGVDYCPAKPTDVHGAPFVALNGHLREELDFGGNLVVQTGWSWRGATGHMLRMGMHYYTGKSDQFEFFNRSEDKLGLGIWYDY